MKCYKNHVLLQLQAGLKENQYFKIKCLQTQKSRHPLSTSSEMVISVVPMLLVAAQMNSPESWRPTLGSTKLLFTTLCLHGRGERSFDQEIVGVGTPRKANTTKKDELYSRLILD